jgi:prepilin-type processing-associated H-X9-DG protein
MYDGIKYAKTHKVPPSEVIVAGEKKNEWRDYYLSVRNGASEYDSRIDLKRHGRIYGSNLLFIDGHVDHMLPPQFPKGYQGDQNYPRDPWDILPGGP